MREQNFLKEFFTPELYLATSIRDFLDDKNGVESTPSWKGLLWMPTFQIGNLPFIGKAAIGIMDVRYEQENYNEATIYDASHRLTLPLSISLGFMLSCAIKGIQSGDHVSLANIAYDPKNDSAYLVSLESEQITKLPGDQDISNLKFYEEF